MKAIVSHAPGGPETLVLGDFPDPMPKPGQVVVGVEACSVNFPDVLVIQDLYQFKPKRPFAPGAEISGIVLACGQGVSSLKVGDRVMGFGISGGMAEKVVLFEQVCTPLVDGMSFEDAAAFPLTYGTAYYALKDRAGVRKGETVLVLGAGSGVGLAAVEIGKALGARIIAAASSQAKIEIATRHGADKGIIYPGAIEDPKALTEFFKEACGPDGADVIYDPVGGPYAEAALRAIAWNGRYLVVGFPAGIPKIPLNLPLLKGCQIVGVFFGELNKREPAVFKENYRALMALYQQGAIKPHISARFPLARAGEAIACLAKRAAVGKIIVTIR